MIYAIKILQLTVDNHQQAIAKLEKIDAESLGDTFFIEEEIKERKSYIEQLSDAISILNKTAVPLVKLMEGQTQGGKKC